jgi:dienelactone hydrolase
MLVRNLMGAQRVGVKRLLCLLLLACLVGASLVACAPQTSPSPTPMTPDPQLATRALAFLDQLQRGETEGAWGACDSEMQASLAPSKLGSVWSDLLSQVGPFLESGGTRCESLPPFRIVNVSCHFARGTLEAKVVFDGQSKVSGLWFAPISASASYDPPPYVKQGSFREQDVTVGSTPWTLPGTLSLPLGEGPFPAVVLVHGSGPNDRDESIGGAKPFRDLAWGLASRGIAVLRYEKRSKQYPTQLAALSDLTVQQETVDDALQGLALLRRTAGIDPARVFVLGHSLGGMLAPRIGQQDPSIAGLIILAGPTRPLEELIMEQTAYLLFQASSLTPSETARLEGVKREVALIQDPALSPTAPALLGAPPAYWLDLRGYQPAQVAKGLPQPFLVLQGERDYQVTMEDFNGFEEALVGKGNATLKSYPALNHLFEAGTGKSRPEEYQDPGHVDLQVVEDIACWIQGKPLTP